MLRQCGWMSVRQLVYFHTVTLIFKTLTKENPKYIHKKMTSENPYSTRQQVKYDNKFEGKTDKTHSSFCYRGVMMFNRLPIEIRNSTSIVTFKRKTRMWIMANVSIE